MDNEAYCTIFLFINNSSGGGVGNKLLEQEVILPHLGLKNGV